MAEQPVILPQPHYESERSFEELLKTRRTYRVISKKKVDLQSISQLLWAMYGISDNERDSEREFYHHTVPSSGHAFPLVVYVIYSEGFYRFEPVNHALHLIRNEDLREKLGYNELYDLNRNSIQKAPVTFLLAVNNDIITKITPLMEDALKYAFLEAGHAAQNLILQAISLGLGTTTITSFSLAKVYQILKIPLNHRPIYILPTGYPKAQSKDISE
jgi:SagB-type dehydrogenase family enzyme